MTRIPWIRVDERQPPLRQRVMAWAPGHGWFPAFLDFDRRFKKQQVRKWYGHGVGAHAMLTITHWASEPEAP